MNKEMKENLIKFLTKAQEIIASDGETEFSEIKRKNRQEIARIFAELFPDYGTDGDTDYCSATFYHDFDSFEIDVTFFSHCDSFDEILEDPYELAVGIYRKGDHDIEGIDAVLHFLKIEFEAPVQMINLTPHAVTFYAADGVTVLNTVPSSGIARAAQVWEAADDINGIPVCKTSYGAVEGLPAPESNTIYIVSVLTAQAAPDRDDLYIVDDMVRDDAGRILGCKGLAKI